MKMSEFVTKCESLIDDYYYQDGYEVFEGISPCAVTDPRDHSKYFFVID